MTAAPSPDDMTVLVALSRREIDALIEVGQFEIDETPDDFWSDETRHDLHTALVKLKAAAV